MDLSSARPESAASGGRMGHHPGESSFPCLARKKFGRINYIYTHVIKTIWVCVLSCVYERTYVFNIQVINVHFMCIFIYIYMCVCACLFVFSLGIQMATLSRAGIFLVPAPFHKDRPEKPLRQASKTCNHIDHIIKSISWSGYILRYP